MAQAHEEHRGDHGDLGHGPDDLEGRPDGVGRGVRRSGHHAVGQARARPSGSRSRRRPRRCRSRASRSIPLWLRRAWYSAANRSRSSSSNGLSSRARDRSTPSIAARRSTWRGSPRMVRSATLRRNRMSAAWQDPVVVALGQHDVAAVADGAGRAAGARTSTASRRGCGRARAGPAGRRRRRAPRTAPGRWRPCVASPCAGDRGPGVSRAAVSAVPRSVAMIGIVTPSPSISRLTCARQRETRRSARCPRSAGSSPTRGR